LPHHCAGKKHLQKAGSIDEYRMSSSQDNASVRSLQSAEKVISIN
jgi:hypothetical protein